MDIKSKALLTFAVYRGDALERRETIAEDVVKVGRDPRSHLRVDDTGTSRMHAVIEITSPDEVTLIDLGNEPGTTVNGQRVNKCRIRPGDELGIGAARIVLERAEPSPSVARLASVAPVASAPALIDNPFLARANPFAAASVAAQPLAVASAVFDLDAGGGAAAYAVLRSGPPVADDEVEVAHAAAVEVMILWGDNVLHSSQIVAPHAFHVGEETGGKGACDYFLPSETLGTTRAPIVLHRGLSPVLVVLPGARGHVDLPGQARVALADLVASGRARPSTELSGAHEIELPLGAKARMEIEGSALAFVVRASNAGRRVPAGWRQAMEPAALLFTGMSFLLHMGFVAAFAFFMPGLRPDDTEAIDRDRILMMQKLLNAAADREQEERESRPAETAPAKSEGGSGAAAQGASGTLGTSTTTVRDHRYAVTGPHDNPDPHLARELALRESATFGTIGLLATFAGNPDAPTAPWGRDVASGRDDVNARGGMFGDIGDALGNGGLGLSGNDEGGGGRANAIGLGSFGPLGNGAGGGPGQGIGHGVGGPNSGHAPRAPSMRVGVATVNGHLPPEVIQRIVRLNFGRFRLCYENGMRGNPTLQGRVTVRFVIDRTGAVQTSADGGSDIPDQGVVQCVVRSFGSLSFPQPEGGMVTVSYPIVFQPGE